MTIRRLVVAAAVAAGAWCTPVVAGPVVVIDDPVLSDWTTVVLASNPQASVAAAVIGAPDSEWRVTYSLPATTAPFAAVFDAIALIYDGYAWDPAVDGALERIDLSVDARSIGSTFASGVSGFLRLAVMQSGKIYTVPGSNLTVDSSLISPSLFSHVDTDNWITFDGQTGLDLSEQGAPLQFGVRWLLGVSCTGAGGCTAAQAQTSLDDFRLTFTAARVDEPLLVPAPASGLLVLLALALLQRQRSRRPAL